jgi:hypothetical protein
MLISKTLLIETITLPHNIEIEFESLTEQIDATAKLVYLSW